MISIIEAHNGYLSAGYLRGLIAHFMDSTNVVKSVVAGKGASCVGVHSKHQARQAEPSGMALRDEEKDSQEKSRKHSSFLAADK